MADYPNETNKSFQENFAEGPLFEFNFETDSSTKPNGLTESHSIASVHSFTIHNTPDFNFQRQKRSVSFRKATAVVLTAAFVSLFAFSIMHLCGLDMSTMKASIRSSQAMEIAEVRVSNDFDAVRKEIQPVEEEYFEIAIVAEPLLKEEMPAYQEASIVEEKTAVSSIVEEKALVAVEAEKTSQEEALIIEEPNENAADLPQIAEEIPHEVSSVVEVKTVVKQSLFQEALTRSSAEGKFTLVKFGAVWCTPCKIMESSVFKHESIVALLEERFVTLPLDVDLGEGHQLKDQYYIQQLPTYVLLDEQGQELGRLKGATSSKKMLEFLESVVPFMPDYPFGEEDIPADR